MKQLKLDTVRKTLSFNIQRGMSMHYLCRLIDERYNTKLDFDVYLPTKGKNLQRPFCWTLQQKSELIISVLKGIKLPPLSIIIDDLSEANKADGKVYRVIDGKQRLSTLISFFKGEFPLTFEGVDYYFSELDEWGQRAISYLSIHADFAYEYSASGDPISDDEKIAWFEMINFAGTPQDIEHLNNLKS